MPDDAVGRLRALMKKAKHDRLQTVITPSGRFEVRPRGSLSDLEAMVAAFNALPALLDTVEAAQTARTAYENTRGHETVDQWEAYVEAMDQLQAALARLDAMKEE